MDIKKLALIGGLLVSSAVAAAPADAYDHYWRHHRVYSPYRSYVNVTPYPVIRGYANPYYSGYYNDGYNYYSSGQGFYYPNRGGRLAGRILNMIF
jgi:hypothetical protein